MKRMVVGLCVVAWALQGVTALGEERINVERPGSGAGYEFYNGELRIIESGEYVVEGRSEDVRIVVARNVTAGVTLDNVSIRLSSGSPFSLTSDSLGSSEVTLRLVGNNELVTTDVYSAGVTVEDSARLTIEGSGTLLAEGGGINVGTDYGYCNGGAGIGGGDNRSAGFITILSGTIIARGGVNASGTATGGAGIGGGFCSQLLYVPEGEKDRLNGGTITINGGIVTAVGGEWAAGIGGGGFGAVGRITINGGVIKAVGGQGGGAGIGGGKNGDVGTIAITNGFVVAVVSSDSIDDGRPAGIGGGGGPAGGVVDTVSISGGSVYATGNDGVGIGNGANAPDGGVIRISGGAVVADQVGVNRSGSTTATTVISGISTIVLTNAIGATNFGGATVRVGDAIYVADTLGFDDKTADIILYADLPIPEGVTLVVPSGIIFDANNNELVDKGGAIKNYGRIINSPRYPTEWTLVFVVAPEAFYTGDTIIPQFFVTYRGDTLRPGIDYDNVLYYDNVNAGRATLTFTMRLAGREEMQMKEYFNIFPMPLTFNWEGTVQNNIIAEAPYDGGRTTYPDIDLTHNGRRLQKDIDYRLIIADEYNHSELGEARVFVDGINNYTGRLTVDYRIMTATAIRREWIKITEPLVYTGDSLKPVYVCDGDDTLTLGKDYTAVYSHNVDAGTASVTITGINHYSGEVSNITFTINPLPLAAGWMTDFLTPAAGGGYAHTGDSIQPSVIVTRADGVLLREGKDYLLSYRNNVQVGTATVIAEGIGNYSGAIDKPFYIVAAPGPLTLQASWLQDIPQQFVYTRAPIVPEIIVENHAKRLVENTDYIVALANNTVVGKATVSIIGIRDFQGELTASFEIIRKSVDSPDISVECNDSDYNVPSNGDWPLLDSFVVRDNGATLTRETEYTIEAIGYDALQHTISFSIKGQGNYIGETTRTLPDQISRDTSIVPPDTPIVKPIEILPEWVADIPDQTYANNGSRYPKVTVRGLQEYQDYVAAYYDNLRASDDTITAFVIVTGIGRYTGEVVKYYRIFDPFMQMEVVGAETVANGLRIVADNNGLLVSGLTPGEPFAIYNLQGQLIIYSLAPAGGALRISFPFVRPMPGAVYILQQNARTLKFSCSVQ